jgi:hypothetical protein
MRSGMLILTLFSSRTAFTLASRKFVNDKCPFSLPVESMVYILIVSVDRRLLGVGGPVTTVAEVEADSDDERVDKHDDDAEDDEEDDDAAPDDVV